MHNVKISALGCYTPPRLLTNKDLEEMVGTTSKWIMDRTGICRRHIADPGTATSDLAIHAAKAALAARDIDARELDAVVTCTVTPDMAFPTTASIVQEALGARRSLGFDLSAACCGFVYGLATAAPMVATGMCRKILVIGADTMSRIVDYRDRATCVLFGDGAGAMLLEAASDNDTDAGFIDFVAEMDGSGANCVSLPAGGSRLPTCLETLERRQHYIQLQGQAVFKYAVQAFADVTLELLRRNGLQPADLDLWIPHQANRRILSAAGERAGLRPDQVMINLEQYGNTTTATIPLATRDAIADGRLRKGDLVMFASVGAGYTAGALLLRWAF
jgi:3-oxoacyl-[acyl-carrier-protein] synthase-3